MFIGSSRDQNQTWEASTLDDDLSNATFHSRVIIPIVLINYDDISTFKSYDNGFGDTTTSTEWALGIKGSASSIAADQITVHDKDAETGALIVCALALQAREGSPQKQNNIKKSIRATIQSDCAPSQLNAVKLVRHRNLGEGSERVGISRYVTEQVSTSSHNQGHSNAHYPNASH